jgi:transcriptional regulator with XRE-family HTH domain
MNLKLAIAVMKTGKRDYRFAQDLGIDISRFSQIKNGIKKPTITEKTKIAEALGLAVKQLYPTLGLCRGLRDE